MEEAASRVLTRLLRAIASGSTECVSRWESGSAEPTSGYGGGWLTGLECNRGQFPADQLEGRSRGCDRRRISCTVSAERITGFGASRRAAECSLAEYAEESIYGKNSTRC